ncbi:uncharacterized protein ACA1_161750 [Acanthamoeba castellanii str. Neff]|uniref:HEAT repeat domain containing protein n=1 Tax=Acanthamoeba castellanii (strain ATCC 30010 / Neff) TaxID=1257118 RepID=L8GYI8_ACACF|nr:uncharacterized protein ACA1_161750 [Acanthamoeba castellanii str. Neff]ELR18050.1 hypothetical protein ACA1_161750 [Acanthamoeba castellanii str. Neff]
MEECKVWDDAAILAALQQAVGKEKLAREVDEAVVDYLVAVIRGIVAEDANASAQTAVDKERAGAAVEEATTPLLLANGLAKDDDQAAAICRALLAALHLSPAPAGRVADDELKVLERPVQLQALIPEEPKAPCAREEVVLPPPKEEVDTVAEFLKGTRDPDPTTRKLYLRELCPCHVKRDVEVVWDRILEMTNDPDPAVRYQVMHNLCDGSPATRELDVIAALEKMHNDDDKEIRRKVHNVLTHYRKTGKWNIL